MLAWLWMFFFYGILMPVGGLLAAPINWFMQIFGLN